MKVLIDICHPAHVHFFRPIIQKLKCKGHQVLVTSREKDVTINLLNKYNIQHTCISTAPNKTSVILLLKELLIREIQLFKIILTFKPDTLSAIGGIFIAHTGFITRTNNIVFYDTENAKLQNLLTYPFARKVIVPQCYESWVPSNTIRYSGYHELSYLNKKFFKPDYSIAQNSGINPESQNFLIRIVSWNANHDINETGWNNVFLSKIVNLLSKNGNVIISTERKVPAEFTPYLYAGEPTDLHHLLAYCDMYVGESATLASEAVVLGIPAVYIANTSRGYVNEQEQRYQMAKVIYSFDLIKVEQAIDEFMQLDKDIIKQRHKILLDNTIDVSEFAYELLTGC